MPSAAALLEAHAISKAFPGVRALRDVSFDLRTAEVHALVGENGAGKSTLVKLLSGIYQPDAGSIALDGVNVAIESPSQALQLGISVMHQEPKLAEPLSIAENIFMGHLPRKRGGIVSKAELESQTREALARVDLSLDPRTRVSTLSIAQRQLVQLAKAIAFKARIVILDEPSASLPPAEIEVLFRVMRELQAAGVAFIYISHHLDEIFEIADRVTVLKDGQLVTTLAAADTEKDQLIRLMIGRDLGNRFPARTRTPGDVVLEVENLTAAGVRGASFHLRRGEVLGVAGLVGAGRTELARALIGANPIMSGTIRVKGQPVAANSPPQAIEHGLAYLAEDRRDGLFYPLSVRENIAVASPHKFSRFGVISDRRQRLATGKLIDRLSIRTPNADVPIVNLSGGNQQKCIIARWIMHETDVLIFDEPTRGIDVGAKQEIYQLIDELARRGKAVLMISSELPEILGISDRILVISEGRITGELVNEGIGEADLLELAIPGGAHRQSSSVGA